MELSIYKPKYADLWFKQLMLADQETMSYNHAYGGTIDFKEELWASWYNKWIIQTDNKRYYRYLKNEMDEFVGEISYHFDEEINNYLIDVLIYSKYRKKGYGTKALDMLCEIAKENGILTLYDNIAIDNPAINLFIKQGFIEIKHNEQFVVVKKEL